MTTDPTAPLRPVARAACHPRVTGEVSETPGFVATVAGPRPTAPASARVAIGAVAASAKAPRAATTSLPARPRGGARAASSVARG